MKTITITKQGQTPFNIAINSKIKELEAKGYEVAVLNTSMSLIESPMGGNRLTYTSTIGYQEK